MTLLKRWLSFYAPVLMLALLPTMASFLGNRYQVSVVDLVVPVILAVLTAALVTAVFYRLWRRDQPAAYMAATLASLIVASNFDSRISGLQPLFAAITPFASLAQGPLFTVACLIAIFALTGWLGRLFGRLVRWRHWKAREVAMGALIAIIVTFGFMSITLVKTLAAEWPQFFYKPPHLAAAPASAKTATKPDIYYLVMEDYAGVDSMKSQLGFDNSDFTNFLKDKQYHVDPSAHNNYPYTTMSVASTMSAGYLNDMIGKFKKSSAQTTVPFNETVRNSPVASHLQSIGYSFTQVGNWFEAFNQAPLANQAYLTTGKLTVLGHDFILNNFSKLTLTQSIFSRLVSMDLKVGSFEILGYQNLGDVELAHYELKQLNQLASAPPGGRFIFSDILIPHEPFSFNADGSLNPNTGSDNVGEPVKQKYVNDVQYINSQMKGILGKIDATSHGQAVVVLLSDEGPEPFELNQQDDADAVDLDGELQASDMRGWPEPNLQLKMNNFAAYHIPAANLDADSSNADSVNVFRLILNQYFGEGLPYLPDCYYVYPDGRNNPLGFASATTRLTGQPEDSRCHSDGTASN